MKWVYFIKPIGMAGPIKIGCSYSPDQRRKTLEFWSPFPLEIVAEYHGGAYAERQFHAMFVGTYVHHEWFGWSPELQATIDAIVGGTFDASTLPDPAQLPRKKKDLSYITEGWRYSRGVARRVGILRDHGMPWAVASKADIWGSRIEKMAGDELAAEKARIEPLIAAWREKYHPSSIKPARANPPQSFAGGVGK